MDLYYPLSTQLLGGRVGIGCGIRVEDDLDYTPAVPEIDENKRSMVPSAVDPAREGNVLPNVRDSQLAAANCFQQDMAPRIPVTVLPVARFRQARWGHVT